MTFKKVKILGALAICLALFMSTALGANPFIINYKTVMACEFGQKVLVTYDQQGHIVSKLLWMEAQGVYQIPKPVKCKEKK